MPNSRKVHARGGFTRNIRRKEEQESEEKEDDKEELSSSWRCEHGGVRERQERGVSLHQQVTLSNDAN
jgi:hypothetical protein